MHERLNGRTADAPLVESGWTEARAVARRLAPEPRLAVYSSPRERARDTADIIAAPHGVDVHVADALDEVDFGAWTGRRFAELAAEPAWREWNHHRERARTPAGDSMGAAQRRALALVGELAPRHRGACVALATHAEVIRALLLYMCGLPLSQYARLEVSPASVSTFELDERGPRVLSINVAGDA
jgi:broad specificity phosphatase PhoE